MKRESPNEDIQRHYESIERNLKENVPLEQFSRHLLECIKVWNEAVMSQLFGKSVA